MNKKLSIAMICDPVGEYKAGVLVSALRLSKLLVARGHHIIFIGAKDTTSRTNDYVQNIKTYRHRSIPLPKSGGWHLAFPTVKEIKIILQEEKIDIIHVWLPLPSAIVAIRAAKSLGIKIIAHSHSQPENVFMDAPKFTRPLLDASWNLFLGWIYNKGNSIIYPSQLAYNLLHHLTEENKPSTIISNGVNIHEFRLTPVGDFHDRYSIPKDTVNIIYVGRLFPEKSVDTLILAIPHIVRQHNKVHLIIVGGGHLREKLEFLVKTHNMSKHISFLGLVSEEDKIIAYNVGDIFVSPSFAELEGMTVLEAMACGKPIIVPDAAMNAARYFVSDNGFLFETADPIDLATKILTIIVDAELRKKMGEASLKKSKEYYIEQSATNLENLYYSVIDTV